MMRPSSGPSAESRAGDAPSLRAGMRTRPEQAAEPEPPGVSMQVLGGGLLVADVTKHSVSRYFRSLY